MLRSEVESGRQGQVEFEPLREEFGSLWEEIRSLWQDLLLLEGEEVEGSPLVLLRLLLNRELDCNDE